MLTQELTAEPPRRAAGVLIHTADTTRFLFVKRSDFVNYPGTWSVPGGFSEPGETSWQTASRECQEETGQDISTWPHVKIWQQHVSWPKGQYMLLACAVDREFTCDTNWETSEFRWCSLDEIPQPQHPGLQAALSNDQAAEILKQFLEQHESVQEKP
tara:strand:- start:3063 stop:3533 length:471 start_codon:yes stop_codon:yes gene_type:complete